MDAVQAALLNELLKALLQLACLIAVPYLLVKGEALAKQARTYLDAKLTATQKEQLNTLVKEGVQYAEQTGLVQQAATGLKLAGSAKKTLAVSYIQAEADRAGIPVDVGSLANLVEATVLDELNHFKVLNVSTLTTSILPPAVTSPSAVPSSATTA